MIDTMSWIRRIGTRRLLKGFSRCLAPCLPVVGAFVLGVSPGDAKAFTFARPALLEAYRQGDFESIAVTLRPLLTPGHAVSRVDSLFAYRLLGVIYAADPKTREMGRHCWMKLLDMDPQANLVDLFVGEELDHLWEKTRVEHAVLQSLTRKTRRAQDSLWLTPEDAAALQRLLESGEGGAGGEPAGHASAAPEPKARAAAAASADETAPLPFGNRPADDGRPYWKRPGTWLAAAVSAGVVGMTLYILWGDAGDAGEKLYHVSNETASAR